MSDYVMSIPLDQLYSFRNHPYKIKEDDMMGITESIRVNGVLVPAIARKLNEDKYELISGHRRKRACEMLGFDEMPVIVRELDDDEATIIMVDANVQRNNLDYSEKAFAYKLKHDALKHQGAKGIVDTASEIGKAFGDSGRQVRRYLRLTELVPDILEIVDEEKICFTSAVNLSYLTKIQQEMLIDIIHENMIFPSLRQSIQIKQYGQADKLTSSVIKDILALSTNRERFIRFSAKKIEEFFPKGTSEQEMERIIISLLKKWKDE